MAGEHLRITEATMKLADKWEEQINQIKQDFVGFLLGSGYPSIAQDFRKLVMAHLNERGYRASMMRGI